jgi:hypothetical protein
LNGDEANNFDQNEKVINMDTDVSITDSETSSDDTRPIVPEKINKPDISLKNKILKTINKSLLSTELTGIDLNMLKLNDNYKKILRKIEKKALERELEHDLIKSFSFNHLADLRKEDIKYSNMRVNSSIFKKSYTYEDIQDLYMPKMLENYKLKLAIEKNSKHTNNFLSASSSFSSPQHRISSSQSPIRRHTKNDESPVELHYLRSNIEKNSELITDRKTLTSPPLVHLKSPPSLKSNISSPSFKTNPNKLFSQIIQEKLNEIDHKMAQEIAGVPKKKYKKPAYHIVQAPKRTFKIDESENENENDGGDDDDHESSGGASTDRDVDSIEGGNSSSDSDDLNMNEEDYMNFDYNNKVKSNNFRNANPIRKTLCNKKASMSAKNNKHQANLRNPGALISEFYISNMNYAMRYSVEYIQQVAKDLRKRRQKMDSFTFAGLDPMAEHCTSSNNINNKKLNRSLSVDELYAVRKENIKFNNGAAESCNNSVVTGGDLNNISFTTDDIQDIYMPSAIENYKRKIAVELERRRRHATQYHDFYSSQQHTGEHSPERANLLREEEEEELNLYSQSLPPPGPPVVVLDDLDIFIIKKTKTSIEKDNLQRQTVKTYQPTILSNTDIPYYHHQTQINQRIILKRTPSSGEEPQDECSVKRASFKTEKFVIKNTINIQPKFDEMDIIVDSNSASTSSVIEPEKALITRERASSFRNYALVHKVDTMLIDHEEEIIPSSSSSSPEDSSLASLNETSTSDTLNNINLDTFETKFKLKKIRPPPIVIDQEEILGVEKLKQQIVPHPNLSTINVNIAPPQINKANFEEASNLSFGLIKHEDVNQRVPITPEKADLTLTPHVKLDKAQILITHPPNIIDHEDGEEEEEESGGPKSSVSSLDTSDSAKSFIINKNVENISPSNLTYQKRIHLANIDVIKPFSMANEFSPNDQKISEYETPVKLNSQYVIEEFANKPINSSVVYSYENVNPNIASIENQREIIDRISREEPPHLNISTNELAPSVQFHTNDLITRIQITDTARLDSAHVVVPVHVRNADQSLLEQEEELFEFESAHLQAQMERPKASLIKTNLTTLNSTDQIVFKELKGASIGENDSELADAFRTQEFELDKVKENKELSKLEEPPEWMQKKVYNLAQIKINDQEASFAHPFTNEHVYDGTQQIVNVLPVKKIETIQLEAKTITAAVLNLGQEESLSDNELANELEKTKLLNINQSVQSDDLTRTLSLRPTTFDIVTLNAPTNRKLSIEEQLHTNDLNDIEHIDYKDKQQIQPLIQAELVKPQVAKKPVLLNKATAIDVKAGEETSSNFNVLPPNTERLEILEEILNIKEQPNQNNEVKKYAMANFSQDNILLDQVDPISPMSMDNKLEQLVVIQHQNELNQQEHLFDQTKRPLNLAHLNHNLENVENAEEYQIAETIAPEFAQPLQEKIVNLKAKRQSPAEIITLADFSQDNILFHQAEPISPATSVTEIEQVTVIQHQNELNQQEHLFDETKRPLNLAHLNYNLEDTENVEEYQIDEINRAESLNEISLNENRADLKANSKSPAEIITLAHFSQDNILLDQVDPISPMSMENKLEQVIVIQHQNELNQQEHLFDETKRPLNLAHLNYNLEDTENVEEYQIDEINRTESAQSLNENRADLKANSKSPAEIITLAHFSQDIFPLNQVEPISLTSLENKLEQLVVIQHQNELNQQEHLFDETKRPLNLAQSTENSDEFLESVKPLDTIELNFQEQINHDIELGTSYEANVNLIMSFNTALEENINFNISDENCADLVDELNDDEIIQSSFKEHVNEIRMHDSITPDDSIEKIALGKNNFGFISD